MSDTATASKGDAAPATKKTTPTHTAYIVTDLMPGSNKKAKWTEVGAVWPHGDGEGFDITIPEGISLSGRIVCRKRKPADAE